MSKRINHKELFQKEMLDSVLKSLDQEIIPWDKPWDNFNGLPMNAVTNKAYNGSNSFNLMFSGLAQGFTDPRWCTFNQAKAKGWSVKKGSKSSKIFYISLIDKRTNKPIKASDYNGLTKDEAQLLRENTVPLYKTYSVFNAEQLNDIPELDKKYVIKNKFNDEKTEKYLDDLIKGMNLPLSYGGDSAYYSPGQDRVQLPPQESFKSYQGFVETFLHEVTHATGHSTRLDRNLEGRFGTGSYAREELVADINSMMTAIDLGIITSERQIENTKAYCQGWYEQLTKNPKFLADVVDDVFKARDFMHEKGNWIFEEIEEPLEVNIDTLSASVKIEAYADQILGLRSEPHSRNLKRLVEHDSCIIYPDTNSYFRYSSQRGGNIYEFIMEFENVDFKTALEKVKNYYNDYQPELIKNGTINRDVKINRSIELPDLATNNDKAIEYLVNNRGLSKELVESMIDSKQVYQDDKNNVVFLGYENGQPAYASRRSTYSDFKGDVSGSRKEVGFFINNDTDTLVISESPIDSLSIMDMQDKKTNHLGTGGVGASISSFKYFVENNPTARNTNNIILSFDNDEAGINASETLQEFIKHYYPYYQVEIKYPKNKDFNLDLQEKKQEEQLLNKFKMDSKEADHGNFHFNYYRIDSLENNEIYFVSLPIDLNNINNIGGYKVDTTVEGYSLTSGKTLNDNELKELSEYLKSEHSLNIKIPDYLQNRINSNIDSDSRFILDSTEEMKYEENNQEYDFIRYNMIRGSREYSLNISNITDSVSGDVIKHGGWYDLMGEEKKLLLDFLVDKELLIKPLTDEHKLSVNRDLLEENNQEMLFTDVPREYSKREVFIESLKDMLADDEPLPIPDVIEFGYTQTESDIAELQAYIYFDDEVITFKANNIEFKQDNLNDYDITENDIQNILKGNTEETQDILDNIISEMTNSFEDLRTMEINGTSVAYQDEGTVWFEQGAYNLSHGDIENKYLALMENNQGEYTFPEESFGLHFENLYKEMLEDRNREKLAEEKLENYFESNYGDSYSDIKDEVISLIKQHELGEVTSWDKVLQIYLDEQVSWNNMNEFANHFFRELGATINTPITSLSIGEDRKTVTINLDDVLSDEDYLSIINFNLESNESITVENGIVTFNNSDSGTVTTSTLKEMYEDYGFKKALLDDFELLGLTELEHSSLFKDNKDLMKKLLNSDDSYTKAFNQATKERDLDNDGIPDRIDIDDTRNSVQSISDMSDEPKKKTGMSR